MICSRMKVVGDYRWLGSTFLVSVASFVTNMGTGVSLNNLFLLLEPVFILTMAVKQILMCFTSFSFRNSLPSY